MFIHHNRNYRYRSDEAYSLGVDVRYTMEELQELIGNYPKRPEGPDRPAFLRERIGYTKSYPNLYQAVYQAITLLSMSDDEHVSASTYQIALEVL